MNEKTLPGTPYLEVPNELFRSKDQPTVYDTRQRNVSLQKVIERVEYPPEGGVLVYHTSFPYPEKGMRDDYVMKSLQIVKRAFITQIRFFASKHLIPFYILFAFFPWKFKLWIIEKWIKEFLSFSMFIDMGVYHFVLEERYYTDFGRELIKFIKTFLRELGFSEGLTKEFALTVASMVDDDTAYRWRVQDLLSETTSENMINYPRKQIKRLMYFFAQRDPERATLIERFQSVANLLSMALWIPRIRRAYEKSMKQITFEKLQFDEIDRYHVRNRAGYDYFGLTVEERDKLWPLEQHVFIEER